jgi:hypothetical protein
MRYDHNVSLLADVLTFMIQEVNTELWSTITVPPPV